MGIVLQEEVPLVPEVLADRLVAPQDDARGVDDDPAVVAAGPLREVSAGLLSLFPGT